MRYRQPVATHWMYPCPSALTRAEMGMLKHRVAHRRMKPRRFTTRREFVSIRLMWRRS